MIWAGAVSEIPHRPMGAAAEIAAILHLVLKNMCRAPHLTVDGACLRCNPGATTSGAEIGPGIFAAATPFLRPGVGGQLHLGLIYRRKHVCLSQDLRQHVRRAGAV